MPIGRFSVTSFLRYISTIMSKPIVEVSHLYKSFGTFRAVEDVSFAVRPSTCAAFLGPNGAGKTTTMKTLYGRAVPDVHDETRMRVFDFDPRSDELSVKAKSGVVPQEDNLDVELNVEQNLRNYATFYGLPHEFIERQIDYLLDFMELGAKRRARTRELSGGMQRRLIIARALLNDPELLILDEPTTGLDPQVRQVIWEKLRNLKHRGVTILLTTHYMDEAFQLADNVVIMDRAKTVLEGPPRQLLAENIEQHVLELMNARAAPAAERGAGDHAYWRKDQLGERIIYYANDPQVLRNMTSGIHAHDYLLRPVNLEDLFIKATGRSLNELQ